MIERKDDFIKKVLILMFIFLFFFTIAMIAVFCLYEQTPDILIGAVFGACVGEYSICGMIKNRKEREKTARLKEEINHDDDIEEEPIE